MGKKNRYKPTGKFIGIDTGFVQAANLLDMAAMQAVERGDVSAMTEIAEKWMDMSVAMKAVMMPHKEDEAEEEDESAPGIRERKTGPVGFTATVEEMKEWNARTNKSDS